MGGFIFIYAVLPSLCLNSIYPDSAQNMTWGHTWALSYNRHPPLGTWLISLLSFLFHDNQQATFTASVLCLLVALIFVYRLAEKWIGSANALAATVFTSLSLYFMTNFVLQYNQNSILLPFWAMICYFFDACLRTNRIQDWLLLSITTAAAILAKYEALLIINVLIIYLLFHFQSKYYNRLILAITVTLIVLAPHFYSVAENGYLTLQFISSKISVGQNHGWIYSHLYYPFSALFGQLGNILFAVAVLFLAVKSKKIHCIEVSTTKINYLTWLGIGPLALVVMISLLLGLRIQAEWGYPLFLFTMPWIFSYFKLEIKPTFIKPMIMMALVIHLGSLVIYESVHYFSNRLTRTSYPSYTLANRAEQYWKKFTQQPIYYIAGDEVIDYYLAAYLPSKPLLLEDYSLIKSPWLSATELNKHGILFVMQGCEQERNIALKKQFMAQDYQCIKLPLSNKRKPKEIMLTLMVVPPAS